MKLSITYILFFLSGVSALMYEVTWFRLFDLHVGVSIYSATAVLTAFMVGLALGSRFIGGLADKLERPLRAYGWLVIAIALYCLFIPTIAAWLCSFQTSIYGTMMQSRLLTTALRFSLALLILLPATVAMGGTLPLLVRFCTATSRQMGSHISYLYAINTLGAALGAYLCGFHLIELIGSPSTIALASTVNVIVGLTAISLDEPVEIEAGESAADSEQGDERIGIFLLVTTICGFTSLGLEVCWNSFLPLVIGSSTYSFSLILTAFLCGLGGGAFFVSQRRWRRAGIPVFIGYLLLTIAISVSCSLPIFGALPELFVSFRKAVSVSFTAFMTLQFLGVFALFFLPTFCYGAIFPLIARYLSELNNVGQKVGLVYWWNTIGTVAGVVLTGFVFIPFLGIKLSMVTHLTLVTIVACLLLRNSGISAKRVHLAFLLIAVTVLTASFGWPWDQKVLTAGVFRYWDSVKGTVKQREARGELLFYQETHSGVVSVSRYGKKLSLKWNGKPDASSGSDMVTQLLLAYIPMSIADRKEKVLIVGTGSGATAGACLNFPEVKNVDVVELVPAVNEASKLFGEYNNHYWKDPRVCIIEEDARNYAAFTQEKYDIILSEPSNPWFAGVSNLMTVEAFKGFRARLRPGGLMAQHVHFYENSKETISTILRTFRSVFGHCSIWQLSMGDTLVLGWKEKEAFPVERVGSLLGNSAIKKSLKTVGIESANVLYSLEIVADDEMEHFIGQAVLNEDDYPILEFQAPKHFYTRTQVFLDPLERVFANPNSMFYKRRKTKPLSSSDWANIARHWGKTTQSSVVLAAYRQALASQGQDIQLIRDFLSQLIKEDRWAEAFDFAQPLANKTKAAIDFNRLAIVAKALDVKSPSLKVPFGFVRFDKVIAQWKEALPQSWEPYYAEGVAYRDYDGQRSIAELDRASRMVVTDKSAVAVQRGRVFLELGLSLATQAMHQKATRAFEMAIQLGSASIKRAAAVELAKNRIGR